MWKQKRYLRMAGPGDHVMVSVLEEKEDEVAFGDGKKGGGCDLC